MENIEEQIKNVIHKLRPYLQRDGDYQEWIRLGMECIDKGMYQKWINKNEAEIEVLKEKI